MALQQGMLLKQVLVMEGGALLFERWRLPEEHH
jgi:hypothetical protein